MLLVGASHAVLFYSYYMCYMLLLFCINAQRTVWLIRYQYTCNSTPTLHLIWRTTCSKNLGWSNTLCRIYSEFTLQYMHNSGWCSYGSFDLFTSGTCPELSIVYMSWYEDLRMFSPICFDKLYLWSWWQCVLLCRECTGVPTKRRRC